MQYAAGRDVCVVWGPLGEELSEIKDNIALFYYVTFIRNLRSYRIVHRVWLYQNALHGRWKKDVIID